MRKLSLIGVILALSLFAGASDDAQILKGKTMVGVSGPYVGNANPIRGIGGGGVPWRIAEGKFELESNGRLGVKVRGLVIVSTGVNPVNAFRAVLSCQTIDGSGNATVLNVGTDTFPATAAGDSDIEAQITIPSPCFAPIVFVTNSAGRWFAVSGF